MRALVVDDHSASRESFRELLESRGIEVDTSASLAQAREALAAGDYSVVLLDLKLPDGSGMTLVEELGPEGPDVVLITGNASVSTAVSALRQGVVDYLTKPVDWDRLDLILRRIRRDSRLRHDVEALRSELRSLGHVGKLIGNSPPMRAVYDRIAKVAPTDASVMVSGESGTGKEVVAQTIHELSRRADSPFVAVNCGAIAREMIESELFGHERGSFTGAERRHRGVFERAHEGTLFLDEVTEMPEAAQVRLLRVLETSRFTRLGGEKEHQVDVRVLAASNRDLDKALKDGTLREDLYYRLNVFRIELPALRERGDDVLMLAEHFLEQLNDGAETDKSFDDSARLVLRGFDWPGNVRELRNAVQSGYIVAGDFIAASDLPIRASAPSTAAEATASGATGDDALVLPLGTSIASAERALIETTLARVGDNRTRAAEILGVSVKTLYNRLKAYEDEGP